jgi:hypothetical protein
MSTIQVHIQSSASSSWSITHAFSGAPVCDVIVPVGDVFVKILPLTVTHVSDTQLVITFSVPTAGRARLVGRTTSTISTLAGSIDPGQGF